MMCFTVNITDDGISESCKSFDLSLTSNSERAVVVVPFMNVPLYDDDGECTYKATKQYKSLLFFCYYVHSCTACVTAALRDWVM